MSDEDQTKRYVFLLIPGFFPLGMTCAQEALALANRFARDRRYYDWLLLNWLRRETRKGIDFRMPSHFSKTYRKAFGVAPSRDTGGSNLLFAGR